MSETRPSSGVAGLRVLAHPLRLRLLSLLTGTAYSAAEAARALGQSQANVSYHLRRLHAAGLVEAAGEIPVRGGTAKRYRHDPDSGPRVGRELPRDAGVETHLTLAAALGEELRRRTAQRDTAVEGRMTDAEVWLDPAVWEDLKARADKLGEDLHTHARPPGTEGAVRVSATLALFAMTPDTNPSEHGAPTGPGVPDGPGEPDRPDAQHGPDARDAPHDPVDPPPVGPPGLVGLRDPGGADTPKDRSTPEVP